MAEVFFLIFFSTRNADCEKENDYRMSKYLLDNTVVGHDHG